MSPTTTTADSPRTPPRTRGQQQQLIVVLGCVLDAERVLLIRRREPENSELDGKLEFPGGKIEFGESPANAVEREVHEETGVRVQAHELLPLVYHAVRHYDGADVHALVLCYRCALMDLGRQPKLPEKVALADWFPLQAVDPLQMQSGSFEFFDHVMQSEQESMAQEERGITLRNTQGHAFWMRVEARLASHTPFIVRQGATGRGERTLQFTQRDDLIRHLDQELRKRPTSVVESIDDGFPDVPALRALRPVAAGPATLFAP